VLDVAAAGGAGGVALDADAAGGGGGLALDAAAWREHQHSLHFNP